MSRKLSKASVNYRPAKTEARRCGTCSMFRSGGRCTLVAGPISPSAVCNRWAAKRP